MSGEEAQDREPLFNAPWPAVAIPVVLVLAYLIQALVLGDPGVENPLVLNLALSPDAIAYGRYQTLITYLFVHGGWGHLAMNSVSAFAFGPPVARFFGTSVKAAVGFFVFFLLCGIVSGLGYVALHWGGAEIA